MDFTPAIKTRNIFHYCYADNESFSLLLWTQGMVLATAMDIWNGFHYCYREKDIVFTTAMETKNGFHYCYGDNESFSLLLWRQ